MMGPVATILLSILGSSAVFSFIQFLITRKDNKSDKNKGLNDRLDKIQEDLTNISTQVENNKQQMNDRLERNSVIAARIRILQASDEMRRHVQHSEEYFDQLHDDITMYENYCRLHPEFKNNKAVHAIENINRVYQKCLQENTFL